MKKLILFLTFAWLTFIVNAQWQQTSLDSVYVECFAKIGNNVFAGTEDGVYLSTDDGANWTQIGLIYDTVKSFAVNGTDLFAGTKKGVYLSTNNGVNWTPMNTGIPANTQINTLAIQGTNIFAGTPYDGMLLSSDYGLNWNHGVVISTVLEITTNEATIYAGTACGAILSINEGVSWYSIDIGLSQNIVKEFAINGSNIFAATFGGVFLSTNNGANWDSVNTGLTNKYVTSLAISGAYIFAGTGNGGGVFFTTNNGLNWTTDNTGLFGYGLYVNSLIIGNTNIYAGTCNGIWRRPLSDFALINEINNCKSILFYPNPAKDRLTIESLQKSTIEILNIQGQAILQKQIQQGQTDINISGLAKGLYILRLSSSDKTEVSRFMKE